MYKCVRVWVCMQVCVSVSYKFACTGVCVPMAGQWQVLVCVGLWRGQWQVLVCWGLGCEQWQVGRSVAAAVHAEMPCARPLGFCHV